jgi:hypothetical protein
MFDVSEGRAPYAVDGLDDVRAGLSSNDDNDRADAVCPARDATVLHVVEHVRNVAEADSRAVVVGETSDLKSSAVMI